MNSFDSFDIMKTHEKMCNKIHEICERKNHDYGNSASELFDKFGLVSYLVRLNDKVSRLNTLVKSGVQRVEDEKIEDTLMDLANYALLALCDLERTKHDNNEEVL